MTLRRVREILARDAVDTPCALDVLLYFHRHPNVYVTTDWLPARLGYVAQDVEAAIELLTSAGVIAQRRHAHLSAVLYRLAETPWSPEGAETASIGRWRRQLRLVRQARARCLRAAAHAARSRERLERTEALLATIRPNS
jgi:hypothetical protein